MNTILNRVKFYDNEVLKDNNILSFVKLCIENFDLHKCVYCPSATGIYYKEFSKLFDKALFLDIDPQMVEYLNKKINFANIKNIDVKISDIRKIGKYKDLYDSMFFFNQGLQYIPLEDFKKILEEKLSKYVILDLFDFNKKGKLSYFDSEKNDMNYLSKRFTYKDKVINRYNKHSIFNDKILYEYNYVENNNSIKKIDFEMFNYPFKLVKDIVLKSKVYKIEKIYGDYDCSEYNNDLGHYILVLSRIDENGF